MTTGTTLKDWDGTTPNAAKYGTYHKRVWSGGDSSPGEFLKENPYLWTVESAQHTRGLVKHYLWMYGIPPTDTSSWAYAPGLPSISTYPTNRATGKVWDQLVQSEFNAGVFAGEFRETVDFISSSIKALAESYIQLRRGNFTAAARSLIDRPLDARFMLKRHRTDNVGLLANNWLTYQYALMPLLRDIKAAYEYMLKTYKVIKRVKATAIDKFSGKRTQSGLTWNYEGSSVCEIRCIVTSEISQWDRLGLTDPASVGWELVRLSFVLDWILPVGNFLKAVNATRSVKTETIMLTQSRKETLSSPVWTGLGQPLTPINISDFKTHCSGQRWGVLSLPVRLPTITDPLGSSYERFLSASSLLSQTFGRGK